MQKYIQLSIINSNLFKYFKEICYIIIIAIVIFNKVQNKYDKKMVKASGGFPLLVPLNDLILSFVEDKITLN